jgi:hypothetical protein
MDLLLLLYYHCQDFYRERLIKNEQSRETGNIEYENEDTTMRKQIT